MKYKVIACKALFREISLIAATSKTILDITFIKQGLHNNPEDLHNQLQHEIDLIDNNKDMHTNDIGYEDDYDGIILGYGLCSNAIIGLTSKKYSLVVSRSDDCIALYMGSYKEYKKHHNENPGTYWYNASWIENGGVPSEKLNKEKYNRYCSKYGEENARFLLEEELLLKNYTHGSYISWEELDFPEYEIFTKEASKYMGLEYKKIKGSKSWIKDLLEGVHDERFAIARPGETFVQDTKGLIIGVERINF